jgi:hypothetical protein
MHHSSATRVITASLLILLLATACSSPAPTPVPATPAPTPAGTPVHVSDFHVYPELEARLPSSVGPHAMEKISLGFVESDQDPKTLEVLRRLGRSTDDIQLAVATGGEAVQVSAFRIIGADGVEIVVTFQAVEEEQADGTARYATATIGGRRLVTRTTSTQTTYLYPAEDIMFVLAGTVALVEAALSQLP